MHGTVILKQWHMKPLCSLTDEERLLLLLKEKKISLKEVKEEAKKLKALLIFKKPICKNFQVK